jgi:acetyl-CoA acetyltransferase
MARIVTADEISTRVLDVWHNHKVGTTTDGLAAAITAWLAERAAPDHIPDVRKMVPEQTLTVPDVLAESWNAARALGFREGAEAMREASAQAYNCYCDWRPTGAGCYCPLARDKIAAGIRALPIPEMPA